MKEGACVMRKSCTEQEVPHRPGMLTAPLHLLVPLLLNKPPDNLLPRLQHHNQATLYLSSTYLIKCSPLIKTWI